MWTHGPIFQWSGLIKKKSPTPLLKLEPRPHQKTCESHILNMPIASEYHSNERLIIIRIAQNFWEVDYLLLPWREERMMNLMSHDPPWAIVYNTEKHVAESSSIALFFEYYHWYMGAHVSAHLGADLSLTQGKICAMFLKEYGPGYVHPDGCIPKGLVIFFFGVWGVLPIIGFI